MKKILSQFTLMVLALGAVFGVQYLALASGAWIEPACTPPACNVGLPLTTSNVAQEKKGPLILNQGGSVLGLVVNRQIKITDGTQGKGKVLTSDDDGLASWQPLSPSRVVVCTQKNTNKSITGITKSTHRIIFNPLDCDGGVFPDSSYVGIVSTFNVCYGALNIVPFDVGEGAGALATTPYVEFYGGATLANTTANASLTYVSCPTNSNYEVSVAYFKK